MSQRFVGGSISTKKDLYKLLQLEQGCTLKEIKSAYKKQALLFHPDRTNGCPHKTLQFKAIAEAYNILSNDTSRRQYDLQHGFRYNKNRRTAPPKNYRKVYAPVTPPHLRKSYDHAKHYEMHYGKGMMDEAIRNATREATRQNGGRDPFAYQSPLGGGFTFSGGINDSHNPFARSSQRKQAQQKTVWEYEEGTMFDQDEGKGAIHRRSEIIQDINGKRTIRKRKEAASKRANERNANSAFQINQQQESCIIQ